MGQLSSSTSLKFPPPGELVDTGSGRLHILAAGQGEPAVVMESAIWDFSLSWSLVQPDVAHFTRAVTYDRAGLGWSDPAATPRSGASMLVELRRLLTACAVTGPYVLVGHSYSALLLRLFAALHPQEVAGMVLLDPAHEDQNRRYPQPIQEMFAPLKQAQLQQLRTVQEIIASQGADAAPAQFPAPASFPPDIADQYLWLSRRDPSRIETMIAELEQLEITQEQVRTTRPKTPWEFPLVVISHGIPQSVPGMDDEVNREYEAVWQAMQVELASLSSRGRRVVAEKSGHMIHHEQPELVVQVIRQVVEEVRAGAP